jgi:hypothetical protein
MAARRLDLGQPWSRHSGPLKSGTSLSATTRCPKWEGPQPLRLEKITRGEGVDDFETVRLRKDSTPREVSLTISPIRETAGQAVGASTLASDITRRKQEKNERLGLIKDLASALTHVHS